MKFSQGLKNLVFLFLTVASLGLLDAGYLTAKHYLNFPVPCSITNGCEEVLTSRFAVIGGIPTALFGALYYLFVLGATAFIFLRKKPVLFQLLLLLNELGALISLVLVLIQFLDLHAYCLYCLLSAFLSFTLLIVGKLIHVKLELETESPTRPPRPLA